MKRYMARVSLLLLASMLISCGGGGDGGDSTSGVSTPVASTPSGGTPTPPPGGTPTPPPGGSPTPPPDGGPGNGGDDGIPLPSAGSRVEESDAAVSLSAGWAQSSPRHGWSGGAAVQSAVAGATVSFTFNGTSVRWIGRLHKDGGIALVRVDGGPAREVDLFSRPNEIRTSVHTIYDLSPGPHTLTIEVTGRQNPQARSNVVTVDAFEVEPPIVSHLQETDPDVVLSAGWVHDDTGNWSGGGVGELPDGFVGGMRFAEIAGEKATLTFRGTSIAWSGYRGPDAGIARVELDGVVSEVDTYSSAAKFQEVVFTATGLADTNHTLTIEVTGLKNTASTGSRIVVDAFDVTTPGRRFEQGDARITYSGRWIRDNVNRPWSEGAAHTTETAGARATFSFTGTSVSWISCQKASIGPARVYIDGALVATLNNRKPVPIEGFQRTVFRADGLTNGPHTLTIEATTTDMGFVVIDAFDVHP
jgi:trimeric autotransporter adhesin